MNNEEFMNNIKGILPGVEIHKYGHIIDCVYDKKFITIKYIPDTELHATITNDEDNVITKRLQGLFSYAMGNTNPVLRYELSDEDNNVHDNAVWSKKDPREILFELYFQIKVIDKALFKTNIQNIRIFDKATEKMIYLENSRVEEYCKPDENPIIDFTRKTINDIKKTIPNNWKCPDFVPFKDLSKCAGDALDLISKKIVEESKKLKISGIYPGSMIDVALKINEIDENTLFFLINDALEDIYAETLRQKDGQCTKNFEEVCLGLEYLMYQTKRFGVDLPEAQINKKVRANRSFYSWYNYYKEYYKGLEENPSLELCSIPWRNTEEGMQYRLRK